MSANPVCPPLNWKPHMATVKYRNPPIEEAVCDFVFSPGAEWDPTMPGRLYELLKGTYPEKPRLQQVMETQVQGGPDINLSLQHRMTGQRVELLAENGTRMVGLAQDRLTIHMLRPYTGWEEQF